MEGTGIGPQIWRLLSPLHTVDPRIQAVVVEGTEIGRVLSRTPIQATGIAETDTGTLVYPIGPMIPRGIDILSGAVIGAVTLRDSRGHVLDRSGGGFVAFCALSFITQ